MARHRRLQVLNQIHEVGVLPLFYHRDFEIAVEAVKACVSGGGLIIEFLNRGPGALDTFKSLEKWCSKHLPETVLGVGSIVDAPTAALFIEAGANFVVSPCIDEETALLCNKRKIAYLPGCGTLTEIHKAESLGVEICKLFPGGEVGGPKFVKAVLGPCSWSSLMPTGGVSPTRESIEPWVKAGVVCVGLGSQLISNDCLENKRFSEIEAKMKECVEIVKRLRLELSEKV